MISVSGCAVVRNPTLDHPGMAVVRVAVPGDGEAESVAGFVVTPDGYVVTCGHVVSEVKEVEVTIGDAKPMRGEVVEKDEDSDLALVKVAGKGMAWLPVYDGDLEVGMHLRAVRGASLVEGRFDHWENFGHDIGLSGNVSAWDCGTPVIADDGRVVGVVRGGTDAAGPVATPVHRVVRLMPQLPGEQKKLERERKE